MLADALGRAREYLARHGSDSPRLDADLLACRALGVERLRLYTEHERPLTAAERDLYRELLRRRASGEPVAYILGTRPFRGLALEVGPGVLVPRPETELLVEWALEVADADARVLDWGTGSGAIALALATEGEGVRVTGVERSEEALAFARRNAAALGATVEFFHSDGLAGVAGRTFELIVANPPYLTPADLQIGGPALAHEPQGALVAGPTGLEAFERIAGEATTALVPGGWLLAEIGAGQEAAVRGRFEAAGLTELTARPDLAGIVRVVGARRR